MAILQSGRPRDVREPSTNAHRQRTAHQLRGAGRAAEATEPAPVPSSTQAKPLPPGPARHAVDGAPPPLARRRPSRRRHRSQSERLIDSWPKSGRRWRWRAPLWGAGGQKRRWQPARARGELSSGAAGRGATACAFRLWCRWAASRSARAAQGTQREHPTSIVVPALEDALEKMPWEKKNDGFCRADSM